MGFIIPCFAAQSDCKTATCRKARRPLSTGCPAEKKQRGIARRQRIKSGKGPLPGKRAMGQRVETAALALGADRRGVQRDKRQRSARARVGLCLPGGLRLQRCKGQPARVWGGDGHPSQTKLAKRSARARVGRGFKSEDSSQFARGAGLCIIESFCALLAPIPAVAPAVC